MGYSNWDDDHYVDRVATRATTNTPTFAYDADVKSGRRVAAVHETLNPKGVVRESRDSAAHPTSVAIAVFFDVTGSMASVPVKMQTKLPQLMGLLARKGYVTDPQVLFGAIGDHRSDTAPLQAGQFESGIEMDDSLTNVFLEGGGGGSYQESYELALYFAAHQTAIDCHEKRGKKGYLFIIGDEKPYPVVSRGIAQSVLGQTIQGDDIPVKEVIRAAQEKYHVFFIIPAGTSHFADPSLKSTWVDLLDEQHVIMLEDPDAVCESIGLAIGLVEGTVAGEALGDELKAAGVTAGVASSVTSALDPLAKSLALMKVGAGELPSRKTTDASVQRL